MSVAGTYQLKFYATTYDVNLDASISLASGGVTETVNGSYASNALQRYEYTVDFTTSGADTVTLDLTKSAGGSYIVAYEAFSLSLVSEASDSGSSDSGDSGSSDSGDSSSSGAPVIPAAVTPVIPVAATPAVILAAAIPVILAAVTPVIPVAAAHQASARPPRPAPKIIPVRRLNPVIVSITPSH